MPGYLPVNEIPKEESETPISDMLDRSCAYYMAIGIPYDEFWNGDYTRLKFEVEAHKIRLEEKNQELWLQGLYVFDAVSAAVNNAMAGKGHQKQKYREKPIRITELSEEEKSAEKEKTLETFKAQLMTLTGRLERREKKRESES